MFCISFYERENILIPVYRDRTGYLIEKEEILFCPSPGIEILEEITLPDEVADDYINGVIECQMMRNITPEAKMRMCGKFEPYLQGDMIVQHVKATIKLQYLHDLIKTSLCDASVTQVTVRMVPVKPDVLLKYHPKTDEFSVDMDLGIYGDQSEKPHYWSAKII